MIITGAERIICFYLTAETTVRSAVYIVCTSTSVVVSFRLRGKVNVLVDSVPMVKEVAQPVVNR